MLNVLVSGSTGFIGSHLVNFLSLQGYNVYRLQRDVQTDLSNGRLEYRNDVGICKYASEINFDVVIHLATLFLGNHTHDQIGHLIDSNVKLGARLIDFAVNNKVKKFINVSTYAQSINGFEYIPQNLYASTKEAFVNILQYYAYEHDIEIYNLEMFDSYGSNDPRKKFLNLASASLFNNEDFKMSGGDQILCMLHIDDIVRAFDVLLQRDETLYSGVNSFTLLHEELFISLKDIVSTMKKVYNSHSEIEYGYYPYRKNEIFKPKSRFNILPKWSPKITPEMGINMIYESLVSKNKI